MRGRAHTSPEQREGICAGHAIPGQCCQSGLGLAHTFSLIVVPETVLLVRETALLILGLVLLVLGLVLLLLAWR